jgi:hypothetical protein
VQGAKAKGQNEEHPWIGFADSGNPKWYYSGTMIDSFPDFALRTSHFEFFTPSP